MSKTNENTKANRVKLQEELHNLASDKRVIIFSFRAFCSLDGSFSEKGWLITKDPITDEDIELFCYFSRRGNIY